MDNIDIPRYDELPEAAREPWGFSEVAVCDDHGLIAYAISEDWHPARVICPHCGEMCKNITVDPDDSTTVRN